MVKNKGDEFEVVILKQDYSGEVRSTYIEDENEERFNLESLITSVKKVVEERKDELLKIFTFGLGICQNEEQAKGFILSWIVRGLMFKYEQKNNVTLKVQMDNRDMSKEEVKQFVIEEMEMMINGLKEDAETFIKKLPGGGGTNNDLDVGDFIS